MQLNKISIILALLAGSILQANPCSANELVSRLDIAENKKLDLLDLVDRAVKLHPLVAAAKASASAAGADLRASKWQRFPSFSVEGLYLDQTGNRIQTQAVIDQPLWSGGRISGSISRAGARQNAAIAGFDEAVLTISTSTAQAFFEVHRWRQRADILSQSLEQHNNMVGTMERRYAQEVSPLSDLELARSRALQIEQQLYQARAQQAAALSRLRELVGDPSIVLVRPLSTLENQPKFEDEDVISKALAFSPLLRRLKFESESARADMRIARASILPQLNGQYSYNETFGHRVGLVLKAQSDGGLSRFSVAHAAEQRARASELQIEAGQRQLRDQLFVQLREYESASARLEGSIAASGSIQRVMESYMRQFASGRRTWLDVMNAVRESTSAEIDALEARISAQASLTRILILSGEWTAVSLEGKQ
ncbi:MAG: hypothetical protein RLZZ561_1577 [Pseudomonadota bacterium]|jgi:adhesin transport system outer membrane protein